MLYTYSYSTHTYIHTYSYILDIHTYIHTYIYMHTYRGFNLNKLPTK